MFAEGPFRTPPQFFEYDIFNLTMRIGAVLIRMF